MLTAMRNRINKAAATVIIGLIALVFVFYGVFNPRSTSGLHEGAVAGTVNGDPISRQEFGRELNQRLEFFKSLGGGQISEAQLKAFRIKDGVFNELVKRHLLTQAALDSGLGVSTEELRDAIRATNVFHKGDQFDRDTYEKVLAANNLSPGIFERQERERLALQSLVKGFRSRVKVSDEEIKREFLVSRDKRNIKFVLLTADAAKSEIKIEPTEVSKFLSEPAKLNLAKSQYESKKTREFKGKSFDEAKDAIAHDLLAGEKTGEISKINERLAKQIATVMTADKSSDAKVKALLKVSSIEVRQSGLVSRQNPYLPGAGDAKDLMKDAFDGNLEKPKTYSSAAGWIVAVVSETQKPDLAKLSDEKEQIRNQLAEAKERDLFDDYYRQLVSKAKIERNESIVGEAGPGESAPVMPDMDG